LSAITAVKAQPNSTASSVAKDAILCGESTSIVNRHATNSTSAFVAATFLMSGV
jgi:hypothetical protein